MIICSMIFIVICKQNSFIASSICLLFIICNDSAMVFSKVSKKSKAVPLHAMVALEGRGSVAPTHSSPRYYMRVSGQRHAPAALCPGERTHGTHCTGDWVGLRAGLDT
jgi:hypothetical protein